MARDPSPREVALAKSYEDKPAEDFGGYCVKCAKHYTASEAKQHQGH